MIDNYVIRSATFEDGGNIRDFIHLYWRTDHPLAHNERLFDFQYESNTINGYNFILAETEESKELCGILGFIPTYRYDIFLMGEKDYWGALVMVRADKRKSGLGKKIWNYFCSVHHYSSFAAIGVSDYGLRFLQREGFSFGTLNHYYLLNNSFVEFQIASGVSVNKKKNLLVNERWEIEHINKLSDSDLEITSVYRPLKTVGFFINRYDEHPFYDYSYLLIRCDKKLVVILVIRKINLNGSSVLRIIDCLGSLDGLPCLDNEFQKILNEESAEYIDFLNYGIDVSTFFQMGFSLLEADGQVIIPNYFEPFERKNIQLTFLCQSPFPYVVFKGDGDQDRPNNFLLCKTI